MVPSAGLSRQGGGKRQDRGLGLEEKLWQDTLQESHLDMAAWQTAAGGTA